MDMRSATPGDQDRPAPAARIRRSAPGAPADDPGPAVVRPSRPAGAQQPGGPVDGDVLESGAPTGPWRCDRRLTVVTVAGAVILGGAAFLITDDRIGTGLLLIAALVCAGYALRDFLVPTRLSADAEGLTVAHGYASRARLAWSEIEKVGVDRHSRFGLRSEFLEIDAGDRLYLLSSYDLSAEPADVAAALARIRTGT